MLTDVANTVIITSLLVPQCGTIANIPKTGPCLPHTLYILNHIYFYVDYIITVVQGGPEQ